MPELEEPPILCQVRQLHVFLGHLVAAHVMNVFAALQYGSEARLKIAHLLAVDLSEETQRQLLHFASLVKVALLSCILQRSPVDVAHDIGGE